MVIKYFDMDELRVCLVQADLAWEDKTRNLEQLYALVADSAPSDLVVLPEMFATGFTMNAEANAEEPNGEAVIWMQKLAKERAAVVTGSLIIKDEGNFYNRLFWVEPDGTIITYNKRHLFSLAGEEKIYSAGTERVLITYKGWRIMPQVCYDLRFPVWCRNDLQYDLLYFVANWPERRSYPWKQLLIARAIENQAYVIGVNRVGNDGNDVYHSGDSAAIDPLGAYVAALKPGQVTTQVVTISKSEIQNVRSRFGFLKDRDDFTIKS